MNQILSEDAKIGHLTRKFSPIESAIESARVPHERGLQLCNLFSNSGNGTQQDVRGPIAGWRTLGPVWAGAGLQVLINATVIFVVLAGAGALDERAHPRRGSSEAEAERGFPPDSYRCTPGT